MSSLPDEAPAPLPAGWKSRLADAALPLLLALSLCQGLAWAWTRFGVIQPRPAPPAPLTALGVALYRPERDTAIYFVGAIACIAILAFANLLLGERARAPGWSAESSFSRRARIELAACAVVALVMFVAPEAPSSRLVAGLCGLAVAVRGFAQAFTAPRRAPSTDVAQSPAPPGPATTGKTLRLLADCALPLLVLATLVFVPRAIVLASGSWRADQFHHIDFYAMAPAAAWLHGLRLGPEFYAQYGFGWPLVMAALAHLTGSLTYTGFMKLSVFVGCAYFLGVFLFLRAWLGRPWAMAGFLLALLLALFANEGSTDAKWLYPSSTVLRYAFDIAFFSTLLAHGRSADRRLGPLAGALVGLQIVFSTDVGLYMALALCGYLVCAGRRPRGTAHGGFALGALAALVLVVIGGFTIANQFQWPDETFLAGWLEPLLLYGGGISQVPIAEGMSDAPFFGLLLLAMLATYFMATASALAACLRRTVTGAQALSAAIALYGMGTLLLFVGRSMHSNMLHVSIPFCLLVTSAGRSLLGVRGALPGRAREVSPTTALSAVLAVLAVVISTSSGYPSVLAEIAGTAPAYGTTSVWTRSTGDVILDAPADRIAEFAAASAAIRRASDGGRSTVGVIGMDDTAYLIDAGVGPLFRYSPVLADLLYKRQVDDVERRIATAPPHWIFISSHEEISHYGSSTKAVLDALTAALQPLYVRRGTAGHFSIYERADDTSPASSAPHA